MTPAITNEHAEQSKEARATRASTLAMELASLEGLAQQFDNMVTQMVEEQRRAGTRRIMSRPGATREEIASSMSALEGAIEKIEHNLRAQYADYLQAYVSFRTSHLSLEELADFVAALSGDAIRRYFEKMRAIQDDAREFFQRQAHAMLKRAIGV